MEDEFTRTLEAECAVLEEVLERLKELGAEAGPPGRTLALKAAVYDLQRAHAALVRVGKR